MRKIQKQKGQRLKRMKIRSPQRTSKNRISKTQRLKKKLKKITNNQQT